MAFASYVCTGPGQVYEEPPADSSICKTIPEQERMKEMRAAMKDENVTQIHNRYEPWIKQVDFPMWPNSNPGPLADLPEGAGVGSSDSKVHLTNVCDAAAKHYATARHEQSLDTAKAGALNYFDMDTHNFETSRDPFGERAKMDAHFVGDLASHQRHTGRD